MEADLRVREGVVIPGYELWFTASRSGGPGGQHANKTSSRVTLHWNAFGTVGLDDKQRQLVLRRLRSRINNDGVLQLHAEDARSQERNREAARARLVELIRGALHVDPRRISTRPTRSAKRKRVDEKTQRGAIKRLRQTPAGDD